MTKNCQAENDAMAITINMQGKRTSLDERTRPTREVSAIHLKLMQVYREFF